MISVALIVAAQLIVAAPYCAAASPEAKLQGAADDAYAAILQILGTIDTTPCPTQPAPTDPPTDSALGLPPQCNFWQIGNLFDAGIDYAVMKPSKAKPFAHAIFDVYDHTANSPVACWYDDFGWWAGAAQRALDAPALWGKPQLDRFQQIFAVEWGRMQPGLAVYDHNREEFDPDDTDLQLQPKFTGGMWNYFWTKSKHADVCNTPCDPTDNVNNNLCGRQNTVTNALYLLAASRRLQSTSDSYYLTSAQRERQFFLNWFDAANFSDQDQALLFNLGAGPTSPAVVRERVSIYASGNPDSHYNSKLIWSGDQGLMLGALVNFMKGAPKDPENPQMLSIATQILDGIIVYLTDADGHFYPWSNVQHPTPATMGSAPSGDNDDYNLGISVLMRNLAEVYQTNRRLRQHMRATGYPALVKNFAQAVVGCEDLLCYDGSSPVTCGGPAHCNDVILNTNKIAVMTAALQFK